MSLFFRGRERRAPFSEPEIPRPSALGRSFARVDLSRSEASLQKVAVWSATDLIASLVSTLPLDVFQGQGKNRREVEPPRVLTDPGGDGYGRGDWLY
ncbi:hypothetical protein ACFXGY_21805, partial [Streptomyces sp. NPDC059346]